MNTDFKTNIYRSFEKEQKHVILKLLPFQQNGNELTVPKLSKLNFVLVTQFIETKVVSEETVFTEVKTFLIIINECPHRLIGLNC
ncbi:conserved protein of unknown function [Vibrio tapetis subsp. tapetis]|uniref:Uncharacterized protein n=1 Tax=Vibrio tapetis subsp. tapetis TaxID=1671868 RepID=A0A2N8ZF14_9VIBR|nr:conserved protein of unknown function [Vibrio tapetis subsp. tapetis]